MPGCICTNSWKYFSASPSSFVRMEIVTSLYTTRLVFDLLYIFRYVSLAESNCSVLAKTSAIIVRSLILLTCFISSVLITASAFLNLRSSTKWWICAILIANSYCLIYSPYQQHPDTLLHKNLSCGLYVHQIYSLNSMPCRQYRI